MIRLAANLSTMFTELPFLERFAAAAEQGFARWSASFPTRPNPMPSPRACRPRGPEVRAVQRAARQCRRARHGLVARPRARLRRQHRAGRALCRGHRLHARCTSWPDCCRPARIARGTWIPTWRPSAAPRIVLRHCARWSLIEPINTRVDVPGYLLDSTALALECIARAGRPNIRLQYDVYHMQIMEGDLLRSIERLLPVHRAHPDCRQSRPPRTGQRRDRLRASAAGHRRVGLYGLHRLRVRAVAGTVTGLGWARQWLQPGRLAEEDRGNHRVCRDRQ